MSARLSGGRAIALLAAFLVSSLGQAGAPLIARAEGPGVLTGRVMNGTTESPAPIGEVSLHTFKGQEYQGERRGPTNDQGEFRFDGLDVGPNVTYDVTAVQAGVTYESQPFQINAGTHQQRTDVTVYDTTNSNPGLSTRRAVLILGSVDVEKQVMVVSELLILSNPSKRTFQPSPGGPDGPMGLLRFGLPPGAQDLRPSRGFDPAQIIQIDRGFASLAPVFPGDQEYGYVYRLPYQGPRFSFEKSLLYGATTFQVFAPESGPLVTSSLLTPGQTVDFGGTRYRIWTAQDVAAGSRLMIDLTDLPQAPLWVTARNVATQPATLAAAFALILLAGTLWMIRRGRRAVALAPAAGLVDPAALIRELADLDEAHASGQIADAPYRERRTALKQQVRALIETGGRLPEPDYARALTGEGARG